MINPKLFPCKKSAIYLIVCLLNGKTYVGSTVNLRKRLNEHARLLRRGEHHCPHLQNAYNKYGADSFEARILLECPQSELKFQEEKAIKDFYDKDLLLNSTLDYRGSHGMIFTEERKKKISESLIGKVAYNKGKLMEQSQKDELSRVNIERRGKEIDIYDLDGNLIQTAKGIKAFARDNKIDTRTILRVLNGRFDSTGGITIRYRGQPFIRNTNKELTEYETRIKSHRESVWKLIKENKFSHIKSISILLGCSDTLVENAVIDYLSWIAAKYPIYQNYFNKLT